MVAVAPMLTEPGAREEREQRVVFHGVTWREYLRTRAALDHHRGIRMAYLEGALEIMSPSQSHETTKKLLARLVEIYALERGIELVGFGSTTYRKRAKERGIEPDECYCIGTGRGKKAPDFAIEVVVSSWGVDRLSIYAGLGVSEIWVHSNGRLTVFRLNPSGNSYRAAARSRFLPNLDFSLLGRYIDRPDQTSAVREYREALRRE